MSLPFTYISHEHARNARDLPRAPTSESCCLQEHIDKEACLESPVHPAFASDMAALASQRRCQCQTLRAQLAGAMLAALLCAADCLSFNTSVDAHVTHSKCVQLSLPKWVAATEPCAYAATAGSSDPAMGNANQTSSPHDSPGWQHTCSAATVMLKVSILHADAHVPFHCIIRAN